VASSYDIHNQLPVVYGVDDTVISYTEPIISVMSLEPLAVSHTRQALDSGHNSPPVICRQFIDKLFGRLLDNDAVHQASPHSRLQSSSAKPWSLSGSGSFS